MTTTQPQGVTYPKGFRAAGVTAGQRAGDGPDLALVVNVGAHASAAAVFTTNRFAAAPVLWSRNVLASGATPTVVVLNAGGANACTGHDGLAQTVATAQQAAEVIGRQSGQVMVCSTGLIGKLLDLDPLLAGVRSAAATMSADGGADAARAIMTTDTYPKTVELDLAGWRMGGMAKGAGMIAPGLATLLVVVTTDALTDNATAQRALAQAADATFNRIDVDGCMSTNDTLILLASGESGVRVTQDGLAKAVTQACHNLSQQCVGDAEGASHEIAITVEGATSEDAALAVARAIARSNLFKCAVFGNDPNWGRILSAAGTVPPEVAPFDADRVDVSINGVMVCQGGGVGEPRERVVMAGQRRVDVRVDLHAGGADATVYTNDLTYDYVKENAEYSS